MRIYFIGLPGAGKTTLGKQVAKALNLEFVDTDATIEAIENRSIAEIFSKEGEPYFRQIEQVVLHKVSQKQHCLISTGGGAACFFDNIAFMNKLGVTVFVDVSPAELAQRVSKSANKRPLLEGVNSVLEEIENKRTQRMPFYSQAAIHVQGDDIRAEDILEKLKNY